MIQDAACCVASATHLCNVSLAVCARGATTCKSAICSCHVALLIRASRCARADARSAMSAYRSTCEWRCPVAATLDAICCLPSYGVFLGIVCTNTGFLRPALILTNVSGTFCTSPSDCDMHYGLHAHAAPRSNHSTVRVLPISPTLNVARDQMELVGRFLPLA